MNRKLYLVLLVVLAAALLVANAVLAAPGDADDDGVPDDGDLCVNDPGPAENNGCPVEKPANTDQDGDGVPNFADFCPYTPGPADNGGCPWPESGEQDEPPSACPWDTTPAYRLAMLPAMGSTNTDDLIGCASMEVEFTRNVSLPGYAIITAVIVPAGETTTICFRDAGEIVLLPAAGDPVWPDTFANGSDTCARVSGQGILALVRPTP